MCTFFGDRAYIKRRQYLLNPEFIFLQSVCVIFYQNIWHQKRPRSVWSRCDAILRVEGRNDTHWTANDRSSSTHQKSAPNSLWTHWCRSIFVRDILTNFPNTKNLHFPRILAKNGKMAKTAKNLIFKCFLSKNSQKWSKWWPKWLNADERTDRTDRTDGTNETPSRLV